MAIKFNLNKYCLEDGIDLISVINMMKLRKLPIYKMGGTYFVDSVETIGEAMVLENQRKEQIAAAKSERAKARSERMRIEREFIGSLEARGLTLGQAQQILENSITLPAEAGQGQNQNQGQNLGQRFNI